MIGDLDPQRAARPVGSSGVSWARHAWPLAGLLAVALHVACDDVVVQPAEVASVRVEPAEGQVAVGSTLQLTARTFNADNRPVSGVPVSWNSADSTMATVTQDGLVTGLRGGQVQIRAEAGGHTGSAAVHVLRRPSVVLDRTAIGFSASPGGTAPQPVAVSITNGGDLPLTGLTAEIDFGDGPAGWLDADLAATTAPTTLSVAADPTGLGSGTYSAHVLVDHSSSTGSAAVVSVTLEVREGPPDAPSDPQATIISPALVRVTWTDNTGLESEFRVERREGTGSFGQIGVVGADVTTYDDETVAPDRTYGYRIRACAAAGCSAYSVVATVTMPPVAPSGLAATTVSTTSIQLSWSDESETETGFEIERRTGAGSFARIASPSAGSTAYTDEGLTPETDYTYRVRACNGGGCSPYSGEASASTAAIPTPPSPPSSLSATAIADKAEITLSWSDNSDDETGFRIERRGPGASQFTLLATTDPDVVSYLDDTVSPDGTYVYRVAACAAGGCSTFTNESGATTYPLAPSGLGATAQSHSRIELSWMDNSATETGFGIERKTGSGSFGQVATVGAGTTSYIDDGRNPETSYTYRVRACNAGGCSGYTAEATATTHPTPAPNAPTNLDATTVSAARIDLTWMDNSSDETGFRLERRVNDGAYVLRATLSADATAFTDGEVAADNVYVYRVAACAGSSLCSAFSNEATATTPPVAPSGLAAAAQSASSIELTWVDDVRTETSFQVQRRDPGGSFVDVATRPAGSTAYTDTGLSAETAYAYRVRSCNAEGCSAYTAEATASTHLPAPGGLSAVTASATRIDLSWTDNSATETEFRIERRQGGTGPFSTLATVGANVTSYSDTGLTPGTLYQYQVRACNAGCSAASNRADATTHSAPAAPSALGATATSTSSITLGWTDNSATEDEFRIERSTGSGDWTQVATVGANVDTYVDGGRSPETSYTYRVRACSGGACSAFSNEATAVTWMPAPTSLIATAISSTEVQLMWTDESMTETGFEIEQDGSVVATAAANTGSYTITGLSPDTAYSFRVRAVNASGPSEWSNADGATTFPADIG